MNGITMRADWLRSCTPPSLVSSATYPSGIDMEKSAEAAAAAVPVSNFFSAFIKLSPNL
ncbi:hypothetical protein [Arthrobacter sp. efr-133-TYG-120]|uniref:hypothetical protein n=1 Tax=Arthrobacter sp. efr-133-TYG-120 TaxID=3040280 RepID=UPI00255054E0|nr:hypothetical protein [Arthrobacter sp. efr-133-TYG-120]